MKLKPGADIRGIIRLEGVMSYIITDSPDLFRQAEKWFQWENGSMIKIDDGYETLILLLVAPDFKYFEMIGEIG
jgi:hypothetical protein